MNQISEKYYKELIPSYIKKTWQATEEVNNY
jgi:hypothetical protein